MHSPMDVVSKAFTENAAPEMGSQRDKTCQMERDEKEYQERESHEHEHRA